MPAKPAVVRAGTKPGRAVQGGHGVVAPLVQARDRLHAGDPDGAAKICRRVLATAPDQPDALNLLSAALGRLGRPGEAERLGRRALASKPDEPAFLVNLAERIRQQDRVQEAIAIYLRVLARDPDHLGALDGLARGLATERRFAAALEPARRAAELAPMAAESHALLGEILGVEGHQQAAIAALERALELAPERLEWWRNLGRLALAIGQVQPLERAARALLAAKPNDPEASVHLANARYRQDDYAGARAALAEVPPVGIHGANAQNLCGIMLARQGRIDDALVAIARARELAPDAKELWSNALLHSNYDRSATTADLKARHRAWAAELADPRTPAPVRAGRDLDPNRRLRIGYLSPDLRLHSVAYFITPLLEAHDPDEVEVFGYASVARPDAVTADLETKVAHWRDVRPVGDDALAEQIRADGIDILVELAGHTMDNRLLACARRPAPVQVSYLGYPNTTGMAAIDYRITDPVADPDGFDAHYTETLIRLPRCFLCYAIPAHAPPIGPPPCLANGHVTFGSFNNLSKVNADVIALWATILRQVDGARLLLKSTGTGDPATRDHLIGAFGHHGVAPERVEIVAPTAGSADHLALYNRVDIALDPFPYNGTTTTCEALWMGVPVITLAGDRHAGRVGASLLTTVGFAAGVTRSPEDYVLTARLLANEPELLRAARKGLRADLGNSPLCDADGYARSIEAAYREIWRLWCADPAA